MGAPLELTTRCPHCGATFGVDFPSLQRRKGLVRCPSCASIFDAYEAVVPDSGPPAVPPPAPEAEPAPVPAPPAVPSPPAAEPDRPAKEDPSAGAAPFVISTPIPAAPDRPAWEGSPAPTARPAWEDPPPPPAPAVVPSAPSEAEGRREPVWSEDSLLGRSPRPITASPPWRPPFDAAPPAERPVEPRVPEARELPEPSLGAPDGPDDPDERDRDDWAHADSPIDLDPPDDDGDALVIGDIEDDRPAGPVFAVSEPAIPLRGRADMRVGPGDEAAAEPRLSPASAGHWAPAEPEFHLGRPHLSRPHLSRSPSSAAPADAEAFSVHEPARAAAGRDLDDDDLPGRLPELRDEGGGWMRVVWSVLCLAAGVFLLLQLAYVYRGQLAAFAPALRPALEQACAALSCEVPYERRIDDIAIMRSALKAQPTAAEGGRGMELTLTLRNQHGRPQAWPTLVLDLTDLSGARVVSMQLPPARYLSADALAGPFPAASDAEIAIPLRLGEVQVNGYQLDKFHP